MRPLTSAAPSNKPDARITEAMTQKDKQIKDLESKMLDLQKREQGLTQHAESLEMRSLNQDQRFNGPNNNDMAMQQNLKQVNVEKALLEGQLGQMRQDMKQYLDSFKEGMMSHQQNYQQQMNQGYQQQTNQQQMNTYNGNNMMSMQQ